MVRSGVVSRCLNSCSSRFQYWIIRCTVYLNLYICELFLLSINHRLQFASIPAGPVRHIVPTTKFITQKLIFVFRFCCENFPIFRSISSYLIAPDWKSCVSFFRCSRIQCSCCISFAIHPSKNNPSSFMSLHFSVVTDKYKSRRNKKLLLHRLYTYDVFVFVNLPFVYVLSWSTF